MSVKFIPHVSKWAQALVPLADRVLIKELVEDIGPGAAYSMSARSPHGPLQIRVTHPVNGRTSVLLDITGEPEVILPKAIDALRAWLRVAEEGVLA